MDYLYFKENRSILFNNFFEWAKKQNETSYSRFINFILNELTKNEELPITIRKVYENIDFIIENDFNFIIASFKINKENQYVVEYFLLDIEKDPDLMINSKEIIRDFMNKYFQYDNIYNNFNMKKYIPIYESSEKKYIFILLDTLATNLKY